MHNDPMELKQQQRRRLRKRHLKARSRCFNFYRAYSILFISSNVVACENIRFSSLFAATFREEERLRLSGRNYILMTQTNVYIINPVVMGFQIQICPVLRVFWSILVKCCVYLPTSSSKTQVLLLEKTIFHKY